MSEGPPQESGAGSEAEGTGETVGEAKWTALRELERRFPGLDKTSVEFIVLSEGERGLLGVGFVPARVIARLTRPPSIPSGAAPASEADTESVAQLRDFLERVRSALGVDAAVTVHEDDTSMSAVFHGRELGLVIGKHGQTIDAIQYLANAVMSRAAGGHVDVSIDAAGYRERRRATLEAVADRAAGRVAATGRAVELEPMTASERKVVHLRLKERPEVATASEGTEPNRHVVVRPAG
jgi:spoIIIJ-associated protein